MRFTLGILACLVAGCVLQPTSAEAQAAALEATELAANTPKPSANPGDARTGVGKTAAGKTVDKPGVENLRSFLQGSAMRLGVEFLPPAAEESAVGVPPVANRAETVKEPAGRGPVLRPPPMPSTASERYDRRERHTWTLSTDDLAAIRDPIAQETLLFIDDIMGEDRRRLRRELGTPILTMQTIDLQSPGIDLRAEELQADEEAEWLGEKGFVLLNRPLQHLARRLPLIRGLEMELEDFKSDQVPMSQEYRMTHPEDRHMGRVSMRVHANDLYDPVEVVYLKSGARIGTSMEYVKLGFVREIADNLRLDVRTKHNYDGGRWSIRADLSMQLSPTSSLHFVAGDDLDFLTTSTVYSLFDSPMDGSPGLLVYALHLF